jgi:hypothetical protein
MPVVRNKRAGMGRRRTKDAHLSDIDGSNYGWGGGVSPPPPPFPCNRKLGIFEREEKRGSAVVLLLPREEKRGKRRKTKR